MIIEHRHYFTIGYYKGRPVFNVDRAREEKVPIVAQKMTVHNVYPTISTAWGKINELVQQGRNLAIGEQEMVCFRI